MNPKIKVEKEDMSILKILFYIFQSAKDEIEKPDLEREVIKNNNILNYFKAILFKDDELQNMYKKFSYFENVDMNTFKVEN